MKKILLASAAILAANVWMVSNAKAFQSINRAWLVQTAYYDVKSNWHPTRIYTFTDYYFSPYSAGYQCALALQEIGNSVPFSYCTNNIEAVDLLSRY